MASEYIAYGIRTDNWALKDNAYEQVLDMLTASKSYYAEESYQYYLANTDDYTSHEESFYDYCEDYFESDNEAWSGLEGLLTSYINEQEFHEETIFECYDCSIHVALYLRKNEDEDELWRYPSQERIDEILQKYINPLLKNPQIIDYMTICLD